MRDFILWLIFLAIDVFKAAVVFVVIFGLAAVTGILHTTHFIQLLINRCRMKNFIGSLIIAALSLFAMAVIALFFFAKPGFEALQGFHFG